MPDGVTRIGDMAFKYCESLRSVGGCGGVTSIGSDAFKYCESLEEIELPACVREIDMDAFKYARASLTVRGESGSYAEKYAKEHRLAFSEL